MGEFPTWVGDSDQVGMHPDPSLGSG